MKARKLNLHLIINLEIRTFKTNKKNFMDKPLSHTSYLAPTISLSFCRVGARFKSKRSTRAIAASAGISMSLLPPRDVGICTSRRTLSGDGRLSFIVSNTDEGISVCSRKSSYSFVLYDIFALIGDRFVDDIL